MKFKPGVHISIMAISNSESYFNKIGKQNCSWDLEHNEVMVYNYVGLIHAYICTQPFLSLPSFFFSFFFCLPLCIIYLQNADEVPSYISFICMQHNLNFKQNFLETHILIVTIIADGFSSYYINSLNCGDINHIHVYIAII